MRHLLIALAVVGALVFAGCKTNPHIEQTDQRSFLVTDLGTGANPEKGLMKTCPSVGRYIETYRRVDLDEEAGILVTCGPKVNER